MKFIPVSRPNITHEDIEYINSKALGKSIVANGAPNKKFEEKIKHFLNFKYAVTISNGSSALIASVAALKLKQGSNILIPNTTIISVLNAVYINKLNPIFIDVSLNNWNVDIDDFKKSLDANNIKALILVGIYNACSNQSKIVKICKKKKIKIIEDASESFGGLYEKKRLGSFGDLTVLSFFANKIITTGEGGMVLTNNKRYYEFISNFINLFFDRSRSFKHTNIGFNFRMNAISCALGVSQFKNIKKNLTHREFLYQTYIEKLKWNFYSTQNIDNKTKSAHWVFPILISDNKNLFKLIKYLENLGIQTRRLFYPLSEQPINKKILVLKNSRKLYDFGLYLPMGNGITEKEVEKVVRAINYF